MSASTPLVSMGMPIYNEERYLPAALDSLLAQDFADFELIISDNASQDATRKICLEYASRGPRIQYYRNERNVGATENFNRVFRRSSGKYFMWAAGHDVWAPTYLSRCLEALETDESIVLANSQAWLIDQRGSELCLPSYQLDTRRCSLWLRFNLMLFQVSFVYLYSLIRASALRETRLCLRFGGRITFLHWSFRFSGLLPLFASRCCFCGITAAGGHSLAARLRAARRSWSAFIRGKGIPAAVSLTRGTLWRACAWSDGRGWVTGKRPRKTSILCKVTGLYSRKDFGFPAP